MPVTFMTVSMALLALFAALAGWRQARLAAERSAALADALADALEAALAAESGKEQLRLEMLELCDRVDRLTLKQGRIAREETGVGYADAIKLSRDGADEEVLMESCGLSRGEARLIHSIYRQGAEAAAH